MIVLLDTPEDLDVCQKELGVPVEQLFTPLTRRAPQRPDQEFSIDNGAFGGFELRLFENLLKRHCGRRELCRWVACPDVVGSARRTLEAFEYWSDRLLDDGWRLALVAQDGIENLPIPWDRIDAIFIGGSTEWKMSKHAADCIRTAKILNKWAHVGRVNTPARFEHFEKLGADSLDGTGLARYTWMREAIYTSTIAPPLFPLREDNRLATCRKCKNSGHALDEFTSPYTGLCAECTQAQGGAR